MAEEQEQQQEQQSQETVSSVQGSQTPSSAPEEKSTPDKIMLDGEEISLEQLRKWKEVVDNIDQWQKTLTERSQTLAEQSRKLEEKLSQVLSTPQPESQPSKDQSETTASSDSAGQLPEAELTRLREEIEQLRLERRLDELERQYGEYDRDEVRRMLQENRVADPELAVMYVLAKEQLSEEAEEAAESLEQEGARIPPSNTVTPREKPLNVRDMSWDELAREALRLRGRRLITP